MSSQNNPLITIGITAFNAVDTLALAIECALGQTWPNKEIIIVDDCSTDETSQIIEKYTSLYPSIRNFRNPVNQGVAASRNIILKKATGEYLAFFDDDDISAKDRIEKQLLRIRNFKLSKFVLCHTARLQIYPDGNKRIEITPGSIESLVVPQGSQMFEKILLGRPIENGFGSMATCSLMMPRHIFEKIGLYDEDFRRCEDTDFTLRFALAGGYFLGIAEPLVTQKMTSSSEKTLLDEKKYHVNIYRKYSDELGTKKFDFGLKWLDLRYEFLHGEIIRFVMRFIFLLCNHPILSIKKLFWALPNIGFNFNFKKFHKGAHD